MRCVLWLVFILFLSGCHREDPIDTAKPLSHATCDFDVYWPVQDPEQPLPPSAKALLKGTLTLDAQPALDGAVPLRLSITLTRPAKEADREFWNSELAYAHIRWMDQVRVWDVDEKWLWPNLAFLLRLPGAERVERYGGMDPGKQVDNDFAAVLIRKYDASGTVQSTDTQDAPLVSAEWRPLDGAPADRHSIVHEARSEEFLLHVGKRNEGCRGQFRVWLIYADFFGARRPATWPKAKEFAGGALAYFQIDWKTAASGEVRCVVQQKRPSEGTGFDWEAWVNRGPGTDRSEAKARLSDLQ